MKPRWIEVCDLMQLGYAYLLTEPAGGNFHPDFRPELTPKQQGGGNLSDKLGLFREVLKARCRVPASGGDEAAEHCRRL